MNIKKICTKCKIEKNIDEFQFRNDTGKCRNQCKRCIQKYKQGWKRKPEAKKIKREYDREYSMRPENRKKKAKYNIERNLKPEVKEKTAKYRYEYSQKPENKRRRNEWEKEKRKNDPNWKLKQNVKTNFNNNLRIRKLKKSDRFFSYTDTQMDEYINHFKKDKYWEDFKNKKNIDIDHVIPQSFFDFSDPEEIKKCWNFRNLRLLPKIENIKKGNRLDWDLIEKHDIYDLLPKNTIKDV